MPAKQKRLQKAFEHASRQAAQDSFDYATELFTQCVAGDPGNLLYVQSFMGNLQKKYKNNKTGSRLAVLKCRRPRSAVKKAKGKKDWEGVICSGLEGLKVNPWDVYTLVEMANAADELALDEIPLVYLKAALEANPKDVDVCRVCAQALGKRGQFDQAIALWHRIETIKPDHEEAMRAIASLSVEKTISKGGYNADEAKKAKGVVAGKGKEPEVSREQFLRNRLARKPKDIPSYIELANLHIQDEDFAKAEEVLGRALEASDGDPEIRERWDDAQMRHLRQQITEADKEIEKTGGEEIKAKRKKLRKDLNIKELEVFKYRCERFPNNLLFKYDLGLRYQLNGQYEPAIKEFQLSQNDPRRKGVCLLCLGECFQQIKKLRLAMSHYEAAIEEISDRDAVNKKKSLYRAGKLAIALKDLDAADKHLSALAGLDFTYKDVSALLDKVAELRDNA